MDEARDLSLELLGLSGNDYTSIFLQGGASSQFLIEIILNHLNL
jgi:phosphoserine aminotransferase